MRDGLKGFSRGLTPRVLTHMPSNALSWLSYEFFSTSAPSMTYPTLANLLHYRGSNPRPVTYRIERIHVDISPHFTSHLISCLLSSRQCDIATIRRFFMLCQMDNNTCDLQSCAVQIKQSLRLSTNADVHPHPQSRMPPKHSPRKDLVAKTHSTLHQYLGWSRQQCEQTNPRL